ncbi:MAG: hypothetical protein ABI411_20075, partial [Tahibacter sp.]
SVVDRTPPQLALIAPMAAAVLHGPIIASINAHDALSVMGTVEVRFDGGDWSDAQVLAPGDVYQSTAQDFPDGEHAMEWRASDAADNAAQLGPIAFAVDGSVPLINISGVADGDVGNQTVVPVIAISDAHPRTSEATLNGQTYISGTPIIASGNYQLVVSADDQADNHS